MFCHQNSLESESLPSPKFLNVRLLKEPTRRSFACGKCKLVFIQQKDLKIHLKELPQEDSSLCDSSIKILDRLSSPSNSESANEKNTFVCLKCNQEFATYRGMRQHQGKVHQTTYKYSKCPKCSKKFRNKHAVNFHLRQVHEKTTRRYCEFCGKQAYNKYILNKHLEKCKFKFED